MRYTDPVTDWLLSV